jgi:hypothetical protein
LAAACLAASVATVAAEGLGGTYRVSGKTFNGSHYSGTAEVTITSDTTCRINWKIGSEIWRGICMRNGAVFSAGYKFGNAVGLAIYDIKADGSLEGLWTIAEQSGVGTETLTPMK